MADTVVDQGAGRAGPPIGFDWPKARLDKVNEVRGSASSPRCFGRN
jgi:hypothetical protein